MYATGNLALESLLFDFEEGGDLGNQCH